MSLKYKIGDVVVLGENVDTCKDFTPGVKVRIGELWYAGTSDEHYTIYTTDAKGGRWWVKDSEINHEATEELQKSNETAYIVGKTGAVSDNKAKDVRTPALEENAQQTAPQSAVENAYSTVYNSISVFHKSSTGGFLVDADSGVGAYDFGLRLVEDAPKAQDNSWYEKGEPPTVGTVCECQNNSMQWLKGMIVYVGEDNGTTLAIMQTSTEILYGEAGEFRPIQSPEQIAKQEREKEIDRMVATTPLLDKGWARKVCESLYDAGYRKPEELE